MNMGLEVHNNSTLGQQIDTEIDNLSIKFKVTVLSSPKVCSPSRRTYKI
jgi:hypothetical protein